MRRHAEPAAVGAPAIVPAPRQSPTEAAPRWAALRQQLFEVAPPPVPDLPRRHADEGDHYAGVGDRSDPDAPPHPQRRRGAVRRAEPAQLNTRPRKTLGYRTPVAMLAEGVAPTG